jgi:hypothetical protein
MRILIVHPQMSFFGGAETVVVHLANELRKPGARREYLDFVCLR